MPLSKQDYRRDKRVAFTTRATVATVPGNGGLIEDASTIDLSESGLRLRLNGQVEPGQIVEVFLSKRPERCRVVWTTPAGTHKGLIAGLEFVYPLPEPRHRKDSPFSEFEPLN